MKNGPKPSFAFARVGEAFILACACLLMAHCEIGDTGKIGRDRGIADMAGRAVGSTQSRLTRNGRGA
jgi:hypothetical protein